MKKLFTAFAAAALVLTAYDQATEATAAKTQPQTQPQAKEVVAATAAPVAQLSADELSFAAKLSEQNRKVFTTQFSREQRKAAMEAAATTAGKTAAVSPNDAVQKVLGAKDAKVATPAAK